MRDKIENILFKEISNTNMIGIIAMFILFISSIGNSLGNQHISYKANLLEYGRISSKNQMVVNIDGIDYLLVRK
ncbi:MAG: hypothetical protein PHS92_00550 [Candidatus Gracilibacteria bacterium]|nr:hypothetical protein [Candidatus Gracilibacteria bacterium]